MPVSNKTILLVDDEPLVLGLFQDTLSDEGYTVITAQNSFEAIKSLREHTIDLLICDVRLHPLNGFEIMERAQQANPDLPVILITGAPETGDEERLKGRNTCYLLKPIPLELLREIVREMLRQVGNDRAKQRANQEHPARQ